MQLNREEFRFYLQKYINGGCLKASDKIPFLFSPRTIFRKNALVIKDHFSRLKFDAKESVSRQVTIGVYNGQNKFVMEMGSFLNERLKTYLIGAYVHGSLGSGEEIKYSDFDALIIVKDEVVNDENKLANAAHQLNEARKFMFRMDPLQHHGWFVLTESDLKDYPETYFPSALFPYAKSLFTGQGLELNLNIHGEKQDYISPFKKLCQNIERKIRSHRYPGNAYDLKNLLSEFMLLPALYLQAKDKKGIYKKFSFEEARKDFSQEQWRIMDDVSLMRQQWKVDIADWKKKAISSRGFFSLGLSKILAPRISTELNQKLDEKFYQSILSFTNMMNDKIQ